MSRSLSASVLLSLRVVKSIFMPRILIASHSARTYIHAADSLSSRMLRPPRGMCINETREHETKGLGCKLSSVASVRWPLVHELSRSLLMSYKTGHTYSTTVGYLLLLTAVCERGVVCIEAAYDRAT